MAQKYDRRDVLKGIGAAGITGLAGCTGSLPAGGGRTVKYGVLLPLTGDLASLGKTMRDAATLPSKQLSDADTGGLSVSETVEDTGTSPSQGISGANSLVNSGVPGICGPASSGVNIQVCKQVLIPNQTVGCSPSSTAISVTNLKDDDYVWRTAPSDALQAPAMAQVAAEKIGASSVSTLYVNNDYGQLLSQQFEQAFKSSHGGKVLASVAMEKQQPSYTSKLQQALKKDPDLLVVIAYPQSGTQLFKDFYAEYSADAYDILVTDGLQDTDMRKQVGNPMKNVTGTAPKAAGPAASAFQSMYKNQYGQSPTVYNAHSYDSAAVLILANAMAGENTGKGVRDNMRKVANPGGKKITIENLAEGVRMAADGSDISYVGASSPVDFDDKGDITSAAYAVWKFAPDTKTGIKVVDTIQFKK